MTHRPPLSGARSNPLLSQLLKMLRDELAAGITAQQALATSHVKTLAELQGHTSGHEGRLAAAEVALRNIDSSNRDRHADMEARIGSDKGNAEAKMAEMAEALAGAKGDLERARSEALSAKAEQDRLAAALVDAKAKEQQNHDDHKSEIEKLKKHLSSMQNVLKEYLGVEAVAVSKFMSLRNSKV